MNAFAFALACVALPLLVPEALAALSGRATGPKLSVENVGVNVLVEWPEDAIPDGYALESSSAISDLTWDRVPGVVTNAILLSPGAITRYFRLSNAAAGGALLRGTVQTGGTASARPLPGLQLLLVEATEDRPL
ncbi:MAG: hypothetical protein KF791_20830, partial [Verrucomicrobiae bacterium]|nr:hypothetical protein [Verrucomicrobiae bacterium]